MVEINDRKDENGVVDDVMIGGGTGKRFTYIKVSTDIWQNVSVGGLISERALDMVLPGLKGKSE